MKNGSENKQKNPDAKIFPFPYLQRPNTDQGYVQALKAIKVLIEAGYEARLAGGCVRDRVMGVRPKDYDIATTARPEQVSSIFKQKSIKVVPTGIDHGTVTIVLAGQGFEVTTLRRDVKTDGRRAEVVYGLSFSEDAERRDFTINALFEDLTGEIYDYFNGVDDLNQKTLRFVGNPETRIREDYLRILRFFRFWARLSFEPAPNTLKAIEEEGRGLQVVSQERITSELMMLLAEDRVVPIVASMQSTGILDLVLQQSVDKSHVAKLDDYILIRKTERALCRLTALLLDHPDLAHKKLATMRLSSRQIQQITSLMACPDHHESLDQARMMEELDRLEKSWGQEPLEAVVLPALTLLFPQSAFFPSLARLESSLGSLRRKTIPLTGQDLMQRLGLKAGPELGACLEFIKLSFRNGQWTSPEEGLTLAKDWQAKRPT